MTRLYEVCYFHYTGTPRLNHIEPWSGPYVDFIEADSLAEAEAQAASGAYDHVQYVRRADPATCPYETA